MAWLDWMDAEWEEPEMKETLRETLSRLEFLRQRRGRVWAWLLEVLSHSDPVGLLATGCPPHEYVPETEEIFRRLRGVDSVEALQSLMHNVFVNMFSPSLAGPESAYEQPARTFWEGWKQ